MRRFIAVLVLCAAVTLAGCQMDSWAHTVRTFGDRKKAAVARTQYAGRYQLYKLPDRDGSVLDKATPPVFSTHLDRGQWLGFKIDQSSHAVAVASDQTIALESGRYEWVMNADPGQIDPVRTAGLVVLIVVIVAVAITVVILVAEAHFNPFPKGLAAAPW